MDTDAIRRAWPNVLGRIFTMRRITWTFVSQNAQVTAFDGRTLTLGIATAGLTQTFRAGNHADIVRQALIDELGVDAIVDGIHVAAVSQQTPVAPPPGAVPPGSPTRRARALLAVRPTAGREAPGPVTAVRDVRPGVMPARGMSPPAPEATLRPGPAARVERSPSGRRGARRRRAEPRLRPVAPGQRRLGLDDGAGPGLGHGPASASPPTVSPSTASPSAAAPTGAASAGGASGGDAPTDSAVRGASAVRQSFAQARSRAGARSTDDDQPRQPVTDDSAVSDDDEDIEQSGDVGRSVIEKVLGGRVVQELEN